MVRDDDYASQETDSDETNSGDPVDGTCTVRVSEDGMRALVDLQPSRNGGRPLTLDRTRHALQEKRVVHGVNDELLKKLIARVEKNKSGKAGVIIAQGSKPENGNDGKVEFLFSEDESVLEQEKGDEDILVE